MSMKSRFLGEERRIRKNNCLIKLLKGDIILKVDNTLVKVQFQENMTLHKNLHK